MCRSGAALSLCLSLWRSGPRSSMRRTIDAESVIDAEDHLVNFITLDDLGDPRGTAGPSWKLHARAAV